MNFKEFASKINKMAEEDQHMRLKAQYEPEVWDEKIDFRNTEKMREIVDEIGWPTISKVGKEASSNAWLLVQHADHDLEFQKKCLNLIKTEPEHEVSKKDIAYLEDRIAVSENKPQIYGSQFQRDANGYMEPLPIIDPENVDIRRKQMGLGTLKEYQKRLEGIYGKRS